MYYTHVSLSMVMIDGGYGEEYMSVQLETCFVDSITLSRAMLLYGSMAHTWVGWLVL